MFATHVARQAILFSVTNFKATELQPHHHKGNHNAVKPQKRVFWNARRFLPLSFGVVCHHERSRVVKSYLRQ